MLEMQNTHFMESQKANARKSVVNIATDAVLRYLFSTPCKSHNAHKAAQRVRILFTASLDTSFIREDLAILRRHFDVDHLVTKGFFAPFRIYAHLLQADVTYTWFASVYSFFVVFITKLLGKKSVIVVGGVDASKEPDIHYGIWLSPWKSVLVRWAMRNAYRLLVVDPFFEREVVRLAGYDGKNIKYVPTGYDPNIWHPKGQKDPVVLTVAACHDELRMKKKGIDLLLLAAERLPGQEFMIIGIAPQLLPGVRSRAPKNVELIPFVPRAELLQRYQKAKVYCQPSVTEGLPNSLCEAMLCECIPVGTNVGGIPTAISDIGFLLPSGDVERLVQAIQSALAATASVGQSARNRIEQNFTLERREASLVQILNESAL